MSIYFHAPESLMVPIDQVHPYPDNANNGDHDLVVQSILTHGFYGAITVQEGTGVIIAGHTRVAALLDLGATHVPVTYMRTGDVGAARTRLMDNRSTRVGMDDPALLQQELEAILAADDDLGLVGTGYDEDYLAGLQDDDSPLDFDGEFAKQRSGHVCVCRNCGWRSDDKQKRGGDDVEGAF